jgi:hypothetical protein
MSDKPSTSIAPLTSYVAVQAFITKVLTDNNEMGGRSEVAAQGLLEHTVL